MPEITVKYKPHVATLINWSNFTEQLSIRVSEAFSGDGVTIVPSMVIVLTEQLNAKSKMPYDLYIKIFVSAGVGGTPDALMKKLGPKLIDLMPEDVEFVCAITLAPVSISLGKGSKQISKTT